MEHVFWCIGHDLLIKDIQKAEGCYLYDSQGKKYVDLESGIWCLSLGHNHPQIIKALESQIHNVIHTGYCYSSQVVEDTAKEILSITGLNDGKCVFLSSGSEAVEFGVQALRKLINPKRLLTLKDSFLGSFGLAGRKSEDEWYLLDWTACASCDCNNECDKSCRTLREIPFDEIGGFVFEPGSSSGLVRFPPKGLIQRIIEIIRNNNGYIQVNEVTTGVGRTGEWFGYQHYDFLPDIVSMGKGLGNGYPVSAIAMSSDIIENLVKKDFHYSQSHQNDPLGCSVAKEVINVINAEGLIKRSKEIGKKLLENLIVLQNQYDTIKEVRGRGLMIAVELAANRHSIGSHIYTGLIEKGFIIAKRPGLNVFRIDPPLIICEDDIESFTNEFGILLKNIC